MDDASRRELADRQARLVRALAGGAPPPEGFDPARLRLAAASLRNKRMRTVAKLWPALARVPGQAFAEEFGRYARDHPFPCGGAKDDVLGFALDLAGRGLLPWRLRGHLLLARLSARFGRKR